MTRSLEASDVKFNPETKRWTAPRYTKREFDSLGVEKFEQFRNLDTLINLEVTELGEINDLIQTMNITELNEFLDQQQAKFRRHQHHRGRETRPLRLSALDLHPDADRRVARRAKVRAAERDSTSESAPASASRTSCSTVSSRFAKSGTLPPGLAVWLPNIIYLFIAVYLYRKAPK